jgi:uncharacterized protein (TIGR02246 family)
MEGHMRRGIIAALAAAALVVACQPAALTDADRAAIEEEITQLYTEQSAAINAADAEAWLAFFEPGDDFLMAYHGELQDWAAIDASAAEMFEGQTEIRFRWLEDHVQVLSRDIAIVTSLWDWSSRHADGEVEETAGTWTVVLVKKDGAWKIVNASESFPVDDDNHEDDDD